MMSMYRLFVDREDPESSEQNLLCLNISSILNIGFAKCHSLIVVTTQDKSEVSRCARELLYSPTTVPKSRLQGSTIISTSTFRLPLTFFHHPNPDLTQIQSKAKSMNSATSNPQTISFVLISAHSSSSSLIC